MVKEKKGNGFDFHSASGHVQVMFHTDSIFIYFNRLCIGNLNNDCGKNRIYRSIAKRHFNTNLSVMDKRTKAGERTLSPS